MTGWRELKDKSDVEMFGHRGRAYGSDDALWYRNVGGREILDVHVGPGCTSALDAARKPLPPRRAMVSFERDTFRRAPGSVLEMEFEFRLFESRNGLRLHPITSYWSVMAELNSGPLKGEFNKAPPFSVGLAGEKDKNTKPGDAEFLTFDVNTLSIAGTTQQGVNVTAGKRVRIMRSDTRSHRLKMRFVDGAGGEGLADAWLNGEQVLRHRGPTGYPRRSDLWPAIGYYAGRNGVRLASGDFDPHRNGEETVYLRFERFREGVVA